MENKKTADILDGKEPKSQGAKPAAAAHASEGMSFPGIGADRVANSSPPTLRGRLCTVRSALKLNDDHALFVPRDDVPDELAAVLDHMLAKAPGGRYGTAAEVVEALAPLAEGDADLYSRVQENLAPLSAEIDLFQQGEWVIVCGQKGSLLTLLLHRVQKSYVDSVYPVRSRGHAQLT